VMPALSAVLLTFSFQFSLLFFNRSLVRTRAISAFVIIVELWRPEVARRGNFVSNFCGFFWKTRFVNLSQMRGSRLKYAMASPHTWLTLFQISSKSVQFRRSYYVYNKSDRLERVPFSIFFLRHTSLFLPLLFLGHSSRHCSAERLLEVWCLEHAVSNWHWALWCPSVTNSSLSTV